jgi:DUF4097 and DUF4098 domain-containing protein YvlB
MAHWSFDTPGEVDLKVDNRAGDVHVRTHSLPVTDVEVTARGSGGEELVGSSRADHREAEGRHRVEVEVPARGGWMRSLMGAFADISVRVLVPEGCSVQVRTAAGEVSAEGPFGAVAVETASGEARIGPVAGDLDVRSGSGDISVASVEGEARINTASGDVRCGTLSAGGQVKTGSGDINIEVTLKDLSVNSASGDVTLGDVADGCRLQTASGDQRVARLVAGRAVFQTASGDVTVAVARGSLVAVEADTVTGDVSSEIELDAQGPEHAWSGEDGPRLEVLARTVSGDVRIRRAAG